MIYNQKQKNLVYIYIHTVDGLSQIGSFHLVIVIIQNKIMLYSEKKPFSPMVLKKTIMITPHRLPLPSIK